MQQRLWQEKIYVPTPDQKFLLDADMPKSSADVIRSLGLDIVDVRDIGMRAAKDKELINYALESNRIIITRDMDFGEILRYPDHPGAIILRLPFEFTSQQLNNVLKDFLGSVEQKILKNAIIIVERSRYRRRSLER